MDDLDDATTTVEIYQSDDVTAKEEGSVMETSTEVIKDEQPSKSIQVIDKKTVHRICSGQVVLDLATAVKELVENSIDSGATNVEIKLKEYGKDTIEVSDNGSGIKECDFESIALKHYTSKLREFDDLPSVNTFGFRGEALSSLSALGDLSITSHHENAEVASKLTFDHEGKLVEQSRTAREHGSTVCVANLFSTLPVRHKEFHRNYKRDFTKLMNVLYAFCLVNRNVRISCVNQIGSRKNKLISTSGKNSVIDTISNIFGVNQVKDIVKIEQKAPTETVLGEFNMTEDFYAKHADMFVIEGYISSVRHGCGRSVTDRQFLFINKRPCDFPKLNRVINEVYHGFNVNQYPFVYLEMTLKKDCVDVNVTPDKRQIMIQQENVLLVIVKSTLKQMFDQNATFFAENKSVSNLDQSFINRNSLNLTPSSTMNSFSPGSDDKGKAYQSPLDRFRSKYDRSPLTNDTSAKKQKVPEQQNLMSFFTLESKKRKKNDFVEISPKKALISYEAVDENAHDEEITVDTEEDDELGKVDQEHKLETFHDDSGRGDDEITDRTPNAVLSTGNLNDHVNEQSCNEEVCPSESVVGDDHPHLVNDAEIVVCEDAAKDLDLRESFRTKFNFNKLRKNYASYIKRKPSTSDVNETAVFQAKISAEENVSAEQELGRNITKEMFKEMEIIGQFNLGFIITKLKNDLFIVDQHATDEKYNYETLQLTHCLKGQRLIQPLPLELSLVNKSILIDNMEIFRKNGFEFEIKNTTNNEESSDDCVQDYDVKISLLTIPTSKNWTFSVDDVEELIHLLTDSPGVMCRPSRVHKMFASRACRKSIMIGTALNQQKMKSLVSHMSEINHPWNCPHGRPTMRHLVNLKRV